MTKWFVPALLAVTLMFGGSAGINSAVAAQPQAAVQKSQAGQATDISARRYYHRHYHRYGYRRYYRPYYPYYARPYYYRPYPYYGVPYYAPYAPAPLLFPFALGFGFGFGPWWW